MFRAMFRAILRGREIVWTVCLVVGLIPAGTVAQAQEQNPAELKARAFKSLEDYVGTWKGEGKVPPGLGKLTGQPFVFQMSVDWILDKQFLDVVWFAETPIGVVPGRSIFGWDPVEKQIKEWVFNTIGQHNKIDWIVSEDGSRWISASLGLQGATIDSRERIDKNTFKWKYMLIVTPSGKEAKPEGMTLTRQSEKKLVIPENLFVPEENQSPERTKAYKALDYFIGQWKTKSKWGGKEIVGKFSVKWILNKQFVEVRMTSEESESRIFAGWDPKTKKIKEWSFHSKGAFAEVLWTRVEEGKTWLGNGTGVWDDQLGTYTIHRTIEKDSYRDVITDLTVGSQLLPGGSNLVTRQ